MKKKTATARTKIRPFIEPMKAHSGTEKDLTRKQTIYEPKLDGIRALCYANKELTFFSRNNRNITADYPEFTFRDHIHAESAILDGEIIVLDESLVPRFHLWQTGHAAVYVVFDILMLNDKILTDMPLLERKEILENVITNGPVLETIFYTEEGKALWREMLKRDMEGVIAKDENSHYYPGKRSKVWLKIKATKTLEALIIGYIPGKRIIGSLALGIYDKNNKLTYIGNVGTGFTYTFLADLHKKLQRIEVKKSPISTAIKGIVWVKPLLVCEVKYLEFTPAGILRAPVFLKLRPDKNPQEVTFKEQDITLKVKNVTKT